jgi:hypothetical protein
MCCSYEGGGPISYGEMGGETDERDERDDNDFIDDDELLAITL